MVCQREISAAETDGALPENVSAIRAENSVCFVVWFTDLFPRDLGLACGVE